MNVDMFTNEGWLTTAAQARTSHQDEYAVLSFSRDAECVTLFGPASAKEAFDQIAVIFNEAHVITSSQEEQGHLNDDSMPF